MSKEKEDPVTPPQPGGSASRSRRRARSGGAGSAKVAFFAGALVTLIVLLGVYLASQLRLSNERREVVVVTPPVTAVRIDVPKDRQPVGPSVRVSGTSWALHRDQEIWVILVVPGILSYYPQDGPVAVTPDGSWTSTVFVGGPGDEGRRFDILAVTTTKEGGSVFTSYLAEGRRTGSFPGLRQLPPQVTEYDRVTVFRKS